MLIVFFRLGHRARGRAGAAFTQVAGSPQLQSAPSAWTAALRNTRPAGKADPTSFCCLMAKTSQALNDAFWCMRCRCSLQRQQAATWGRTGSFQAAQLMGHTVDSPPACAALLGRMQTRAWHGILRSHTGSRSISNATATLKRRRRSSGGDLLQLRPQQTPPQRRAARLDPGAHLLQLSHQKLKVLAARLHPGGLWR